MRFEHASKSKFNRPLLMWPNKYDYRGDKVMKGEWFTEDSSLILIAARGIS